MNLFKKLSKKAKSGPIQIGCQVAGSVIDIKETNDPMFSTEALGKGVGISASQKKIVAPVSGTITTFFPTNHAVGITSDDGAELLIHVGVDTVELNGKYFTPHKKQGDTVNQGDLLLEADFESIVKEGYDPTVMLVVTNSASYQTIQPTLGTLSHNETVMEIQ